MAIPGLKIDALSRQGEEGCGLAETVDPRMGECKSLSQCRAVRGLPVEKGLQHRPGIVYLPRFLQNSDHLRESAFLIARPEVHGDHAVIEKVGELHVCYYIADSGKAGFRRS